MLMKASSQSLTEQLSARFAERIRNRLLAAGARLPSVRQCAQQQGVSPSTVVAAYDQLLAQGLVEARKNRGFFAWYRGLALGGTLRVSQTQLLQPFLAILFSVPLLGEALDSVTLGFAAAVVATVVLGKNLARTSSDSTTKTASRST